MGAGDALVSDRPTAEEQARAVVAVVLAAAIAVALRSVAVVSASNPFRH
jgi:phosphotransacetylase